MTVDLIIEAFLTCLADILALNIQTARVMKQIVPKRGEMEEKQEDFSLCRYKLNAFDPPERLSQMFMEEHQTNFKLSF